MTLMLVLLPMLSSCCLSCMVPQQCSTPERLGLLEYHAPLNVVPYCVHRMNGKIITLTTARLPNGRRREAWLLQLRLPRCMMALR